MIPRHSLLAAYSKRLKHAGCICTLLFAFASAYAQVPLPPTGLAKDSLLASQKVARHPEQVDAMDLIRAAFGIKIPVTTDSAKLKPDHLFFAMFPVVGYALQSGIVGLVSMNGSFYLGDPHTTNMSTITSNPEYTGRAQFIMPLISNIWTPNNKYNFLGSYRYFKYPSNTYGLGENTSINNIDVIDYKYLQLSQEALVHVKSDLYAGVGYAFDDHFDLNEEHTPVTNYPNYDLVRRRRHPNDTTNRTISSGLLLHVKYDSRVNANNPENALFASMTLRSNFKFLGSDHNWQSVNFEVRKYISLSHKWHSVLALWSWNQFTLHGQAPYFDLPSTGWDVYNNTGRGYIQGRYRGDNMMYDEAEYRFDILRNGLLGGVVFANVESVSGISEVQNNHIIYVDPTKFTGVNPGEGFGIRIKIQKYSESNLCIDYGFGTQGSRGFFFNLSEVF